jgi:purine nucleoside phosphorylase
VYQKDNSFPNNFHPSPRQKHNGGIIMPQVKIAIIGGSGLDDIEGISGVHYVLTSDLSMGSMEE